MMFYFCYSSARKAIEKVEVNQQGLLRFIACTEIMLMPAVILMMLRYVTISCIDLTVYNFVDITMIKL